MKEPKFTKEEKITLAIATVIAFAICYPIFFHKPTQKTKFPKDNPPKQESGLLLSTDTLKKYDTIVSSPYNPTPNPDIDRYQDELDYYLDDPEDIITYPEEIFDFNDD